MKSYSDYVNTDDFEGAKKRFENTNKRWKNYWWECLTEIFKTSKKWIKKYILDPINQVISEAITTADEMVEIQYNNFKDDGNNCYLFKFYTYDDTVISKIGTSTRSVLGRIIQEINAYRKNGFDIYKGVIESVIDCGTLPPEGAESRARAEFIKKYPNTYLKNDRFIGVDIPTEDFNNLITAYLA